MIHFFGNQDRKVFAVQTAEEVSAENNSKLTWLIWKSTKNKRGVSRRLFCWSARAAMITPWSTNAVEISQNMGVSKESLELKNLSASTKEFSDFDPMISQKFERFTSRYFYGQCSTRKSLRN